LQRPLGIALRINASSILLGSAKRNRVSPGKTKDPIDPYNDLTENTDSTTHETPANIRAKELLAAAGAPFGDGHWSNNGAEADGGVRQVRRQPVVLRAQVHRRGRGKGRFPSSGFRHRAR